MIQKASAYEVLIRTGRSAARTIISVLSINFMIHVVLRSRGSKAPHMRMADLPLKRFGFAFKAASDSWEKQYRDVRKHDMELERREVIHVLNDWMEYTTGHNVPVQLQIFTKNLKVNMNVPLIYSYATRRSLVPTSIPQYTKRHT